MIDRAATQGVRGLFSGYRFVIFTGDQKIFVYGVNYECE